MSLKDYRVEPDEGFFEKVEKRLQRRRWMRRGGVAIGVLAVAGVLLTFVGQPKADTETIAEEAVEVAQYISPDNEVITEEVIVDTRAVQNTMLEPYDDDEVVAIFFKEEQHKETPAAVVPSAQPLQQPTTISTPSAEQPLPQEAAIVPTLQTVETEEATQPETAAPVKTSIKEGEPQPQPVHEDNLAWAPNVIIPNGDVDENRTFKMKFSSAVSDFQIQIFNRGGRRVFSSSDPAFEWDGTHDGAALPQSAYVWVAQFKGTDGVKRQLKGTVTLIR